MKVFNTRPLKNGYNKIASIAEHPTLFMDFGIIRLSRDERYQSSEQKERVLLLLEGEIIFRWNGLTVGGERYSWWRENGICLHVPAGESFEVIGRGDEAELILCAAVNSNLFPGQIHFPQATSICGPENSGGETTEQIIREIINKSDQPRARLTLNEYLPRTGSWLEFSRQVHGCPEIHYYKFYPHNGYALLRLGQDAWMIENGDAVITCDGSKGCSVCGVPGYQMNCICCAYQWD